MTRQVKNNPCLLGGGGLFAWTIIVGVEFSLSDNAVNDLFPVFLVSPGVQI